MLDHCRKQKVKLVFEGNVYDKLQIYLPTHPDGSVHSGESIGTIPKKWPMWRPDEFEGVEKAMLRFAENCYSESVQYDS